MRRGRRLLALVVGMVVLAITIPTVAAASTIWTKGWTVHAVVSDSMTPGISRGSVVVAEPVDTGHVTVGSVIVFAHPRDGRSTVVHRVRRIVDEGSGLFFETQGDANSSPDADLVPAGNVRGRVTNHIVGLGAIVARLSDPTVGTALVVGAALVLVLSETTGKVTRRRGRIASLLRERELLLVRIAALEARQGREPVVPRRRGTPLVADRSRRSS